MPARATRRAIIGGAIAGVSAAAAFGAGAADADSVAKLNNAHDMLTKARALLGAVNSRASYGKVEKAKASVDAALAQVASAVKANGG